MFSTLFFLSTLLFWSAVIGTAGAAVLQEVDGIHATVYYDLTNELCSDTAAGDPFTTAWAETSGINDGIPFCQGQVAKSLKDLGTNRIVAMNANNIIGDPAKWCGKEVQITQADGTVLDFGEGPLFIWDACAACTNDQIIDLSAKAFVQLKGGSCAGNNPTGLKVQVLDNNIWEYGSGGSESGSSQVPTTSESQPTSTTQAEPTTQATSPSTSSSVPVPSSSSTSSSTAATASSTAAVTSVDHVSPYSSTGAVTTILSVTSSSPALPTTSSSGRFSKGKQAHSSGSPGIDELAVASGNITVGATSAKSSSSDVPTDSSSTSPLPTDSTFVGCTYGAWQCDGMELQVCNYVSLTKLDWQTIETCNSICEFTASGSVDCE